MVALRPCPIFEKTSVSVCVKSEMLVAYLFGPISACILLLKWISCDLNSNDFLVFKILGKYMNECYIQACILLQLSFPVNFDSKIDSTEFYRRLPFWQICNFRGVRM